MILICALVYSEPQSQFTLVTGINMTTIVKINFHANQFIQHNHSIMGNFLINTWYTQYMELIWYHYQIMHIIGSLLVDFCINVALFFLTLANNCKLT